MIKIGERATDPFSCLDAVKADCARLDVAKLVNKLHVAGWTHGDIEYRHVVVSCDTDVSLALDGRTG